MVEEGRRACESSGVAPRAFGDGQSGGVPIRPGLGGGSPPSRREGKATWNEDVSNVRKRKTRELGASDVAM